MSTAREMMAAGTPAGQAKAINGAVGTLAAAGSTSADAAAIVASVTTVSSGSGGVILPAATAGDEFFVANGSGSSVTLYPPSGGTINGGSSESLGNTTVAIAKATGNLTYVAVLGA